MNHHTELSFLAVALIALGAPFIIHTFVRKFIPLVVLQILVGIALGPTVLAHISPEAFTFVSESAVISKAIGFLAVVVFAFKIGMELDADSFASNGQMKPLMIVSAVSLIVPLLVALPVGLYFGTHPELLGPNGTPVIFATAFSICVAVTALPVLAAKLNQMGLNDKHIGKVALFGATFNDGALWILIALFMALVAANTGGAASFVSFVLLSLAYFGVMWFVVRPLLTRVRAKSKHGSLTISMVLCCASALATHVIGLHALLGAVIAGMVIPASMKHKVEKDLGILNEFIFLPFFFVATGMMTEIPLKADPIFWQLALGATLLTIVTKLIPTALAAQKLKLCTPAESWKLGCFMSAKGLMEIVVLKIMLEMGIISNTTFGALVVMAVLTTAYVMPAVKLISRRYRQPLDTLRPAIVTNAPLEVRTT